MDVHLLSLIHHHCSTRFLFFLAPFFFFDCRFDACLAEEGEMGMDSDSGSGRIPFCLKLQEGRWCEVGLASKVMQGSRARAGARGGQLTVESLLVGPGSSWMWWQERPWDPVKGLQGPPVVNA